MSGRLGEPQPFAQSKDRELYSKKAQLFIAGSVVEKKRVDNLLPQGWAIRSTEKISRFNSKQKSNLDENFKISEQTGKKADPEDLARDMRYAQEMVAWKFTPAAWISFTPQHILSKIVS